MKNSVVVKFNSNPANLIVDTKKSTVVCKQPFKKEPNFSLKIEQIVKTEILTREQLKNKSVIGRAAAGGLLFGATGAIVGGLSATIPDTKTIEFLCIETTDGKTYVVEITKGKAAAVIFDINKAKRLS